MYADIDHTDGVRHRRDGSVTAGLDVVKRRLDERGCGPVTRDGKGWKALCPAHDDQTPSLSIAANKRDYVTVHCRAGCDWSDVYAALGLALADLWPSEDHDPGERGADHGHTGPPAGWVFVVEQAGGGRKAKPAVEPMTEVERYPYRTEDGILSYYTVRYVPKTFRGRQPDGTGVVPVEQRILYRLQQLLAAISDRKTVYVVEGEQDCDTLARHGIPATTCAFGAESWLDQYDPSFKGAAEVRIIADRDRKGYLHALDVARHLRPIAEQVTLWLGAVETAKADVTDHLEAGYSLEDLVPITEDELERLADDGRLPGAEIDPRRIVLTRASSIVPRPVTWLWQTGIGEGRMPAGSLAIAAGRAGIGKSQFAVWATSQITTGSLPGCHLGHARSVIYCTTEDSWEMTVLPRLMAAGADLDRVYRADVEHDGMAHARLTLPRDVDRLQEAIEANDVVLVVLDPLLSLIDRQIDDYRSREVRDGLEPVVALADRAQVVVLGIAHFTKATGSDPLLAISGSAAFGQLIRSAIGFARDEDHEQYVLSTVKNNLGREDLPSLSYTIDPAAVDTPTGPAHVSQFVLTGEESDLTVADLLRNAAGPEGTVKRDAAAVWLQGWLAEQGGSAPRAAVISAGKNAGFTERTLKRARTQAGVDSERQGFPGASVWRLADPVGPQSDQSGHTRARGPSGPTVAQQEMGLQVCDRCGESADRLITHHATRERLCPDCCRDEAG
jgi:hypothetical protein